MAVGDGDTIGVAGTNSFCGATCKKTTFEITSTVAQTLHISAGVRDRAAYYEDPCIQAASGGARHTVTVGTTTRIWD
jgi:hypothetical protein